jgi:hypothetical protein
VSTDLDSAVTLRAALFDGEYDELGAWTGESREELKAQEEYHEGERRVWQAWAGPQVVGLMKPWRRPDNRHTLYFGPCRPNAYAVLVAQVPGECYTTVDGADYAAMESSPDSVSTQSAPSCGTQSRSERPWTLGQIHW